jgi:prepilin-type N-terminal cleavage/methylation domain-containing protein/prepilin-type processing-associated H-X9-DG protein
MRNRKAFTLIELLVVIAIIAILAAILFPVFAAAREKARQATCASNEKQICLSLIAYSQDFDEQFPMCWTDESNSHAFPSLVAYTNWVGLITPYDSVGSSYRSQTLVFQCPDDNVKNTYRGTGNSRTYALAGAVSSTSATWGTYDSAAITSNSVAGQGFAGPVMNGLGGWDFQSGRQLSTIPTPASLFMLVEIPGCGDTSEQGCAVCDRPDTDPQAGNYTTACDSSGDGCGQNFLVDNYNSTTPSQTPVTGLHSGGWNYGFADGHVKWMMPQQTVASNYVWNTWTTNPHGYWSLTPTN